MSVKDKLIAAKAVIANPENWCQHYFAKDAKGNPTKVSEGCQFCTLGALNRAGAYTGDIFAYVRLAIDELHGKDLGVADFNDSHTHAEVMAVFDKAIELAS